MENSKLLVVRWDKMNAGSYYIGPKHKAKYIGNGSVNFDSYSGTYTFDGATREVKLDTGVEIRKVNIVNWCIIDSDSSYPDWF